VQVSQRFWTSNGRLRIFLWTQLINKCARRVHRNDLVKSSKDCGSCLFSSQVHESGHFNESEEGNQCASNLHNKRIPAVLNLNSSRPLGLVINGQLPHLDMSELQTPPEDTSWCKRTAFYTWKINATRYDSSDLQTDLKRCFVWRQMNFFLLCADEKNLVWEHKSRTSWRRSQPEHRPQCTNSDSVNLQSVNSWSIGNWFPGKRMTLLEKIIPW
jgi:hypothetical protein